MKAYTAVSTCIILLFSAAEVPADSGSLRGVIRDDKTGNKLIGAGAFLMGTKIGATTDLDGRYEIKAIEPGVYDVRFSYMGYESAVVKGVEIEAGERTELDVRLKSDQSKIFTLEEIRVTAERVLSTETAVLTDRMKAAVIGDAISAEQISRSPDATSGDALRRVTGLSVVDDKFVNVRGVTDRYNATSLDGVTVTGTDTDVDKKSFAYDLIPASLLSNTVVVKTASPDLPGDFSGGYVQVNTMDFPSRRVMSAGFSAGGDDQTTNTGMAVPAAGGDTDWLGLDDGGREFPYPDVGVKDDFWKSKPNRYELAARLPNNWALSTKKAPYKKSFNFAYGDQYFLPNDSEFGLVAAWVYRNSFEVQDFIHDRRGLGHDESFFKGTRNKYGVLWGLILNANYRFSWLGRDNHKLSFKNSRTQSAKEGVATQRGFDADAEEIKRRTIEWNQRSLYVGQVGGEHKLDAVKNLKLKWKYHWSNSDAEEPDRRQVDYANNEEPPEELWILVDNSRSWSELDETLRGYSLDVSYDLPRNVKLRAGMGEDRRERSYKIQSWTTDRYFIDFRRNSHLLLLPPEEVFDGDNYGNGKFDFIIASAFTGNYEGTHDVQSYYGMLDVPFRLAGQQFRMVGGARVEDSDQRVISDLPFERTARAKSRIDEKDVLPSANFTYVLNQYTERLLGENVKANLRLAYGRTVNRPELREMSSVRYFDFDNDQNVVGKPGLRRALIDNYDLRFEVFPGAGEVLSFSVFRKHMTDAIEDTLINAPDRFERSFRNAPEVTNNGWEVEIRKRLGLTRYMDNVTFTGNYTRVFSVVEYEEHVTGGTRTRHRTLRGQAPWTLNASLTFTEPTLGTTINVLYNKIGRRLDALGDIPSENIYEEPYAQIDLAVSQRLAYGTRLKFAVKDLKGEDKLYTVGPEAFPYSMISEGTSYSLSLSYRF